MRTIINIALLCYLLTGACLAAELSAVQAPNYQRVVLASGVTVLLMERHDVPLIAFTATLRGGALLDSPGKYGATNLLAQLLIKGAGTRDAQQFAEAVASAGGALDAQATLETVVIKGQFMARDQHLVIELLSDVLQRPHLGVAEFEKLRQRQIETLQAAKDSDLEALLPIYATSALFATHPYARPVSGDESTLARLQYQDMQQLYQQQFGADRLIISVAGDFNSKQVSVQLTKQFNNWHRAVEKLIPTSAAVAKPGRSVVLIDAPESVQSYFWIGNVGVTRTNEDRVALKVANTLLGGRYTSLLNSALRINSGLTYGARSLFDLYSQPGSWSMASYTKTASTIEALDIALDTYTKFRSYELDESSLQSGQNYLLGHYPLKFETAEQWADALAELEFYHLPRSEIEGYATAVRAVRSSDTTNAVTRWLPDEKDLLIVVIGNAAAIRESLTKYGVVTEMKLVAPTFSIH